MSVRNGWSAGKWLLMPALLAGVLLLPSSLKAEDADDGWFDSLYDADTEWWQPSDWMDEGRDDRSWWGDRGADWAYIGQYDDEWGYGTREDDWGDSDYAYDNRDPYDSGSYGYSPYYGYGYHPFGYGYSYYSNDWYDGLGDFDSWYEG